jgi:hypothetical protein
MDQQEIRRLAKIGAGVRLAELERERAALLRVFPGLRAVSAVSSRTSSASDGAKAAGPAVRRRRRGMSAGARKAVSLRMKRYWAKRRKAEGPKTTKA